MPSDPELADSLDKIRDYHALGSIVSDTKYGSMATAAEHLGLNIDYMRGVPAVLPALHPCPTGSPVPCLPSRRVRDRLGRR